MTGRGAAVIKKLCRESLWGSKESTLKFIQPYFPFPFYFYFLFLIVMSYAHTVGLRHIRRSAYEFPKINTT